MCALRQRSRWLAVLSLAACIALPARAVPPEPQPPANPAADTAAGAAAPGDVVEKKIHPLVRSRARTQATVSVFLVLTLQPQRDILERARAASSLKNQAAETRYRQTLQMPFASPEEVRQARAGLDAMTLELRQEAFRAIENAIGPQQDSVENLLRQLGATRIGRYHGINMLTAEVPSGALDQLEADAAIARVWPVDKLQALIVNSVPAIGAPTFWTSGYTGAGESVAVLDSGVRTNHPAFAGKTINSQVFLTYGSTDPCFNDNAQSPQDLIGHGTHVAGIVASQGAMQGSTDWTHYQGVAKGIDALYNLKVGYLLTLTQACSGETTESLAAADMRDVADALDWAVANSPLEVLNFSYGEQESADDDPGAQLFDYYADTYDLSIAVAAGNSDGDSRTICSPGIGYNIVSVGNWDTGGLPNNSQEVINPTSSQGPTSGGRNKPDLAAPGTNIYSTAYNWDGNGGKNPDFVPHTGTSMAAPHIAGSLALLRSTLPTGPEQGMIAKAIMLNNVDQGGWQPDRGWGYEDLRTAWTGRSLYDLITLGPPTTVPPHQVYTGPLTGTLLKATAVWNRHLTGPSTDSNGYATFSSWTYNPFHLSLWDQATGAQVLMASLEDEPPSNVTQLEFDLTGEHPANGVLIVSGDWTEAWEGTTEPVAVAFSSAFTRATGPVLNLNCSVPQAILAAVPFQMSCSLSNSGDLPAYQVIGQVVSPAGFTGDTALSFGDVPSGQSASSASLTLTAPVTVGDYTITASVTGTSYTAWFPGSTSLPAHVVQNPNWFVWLGSVCPSIVTAGGGAFQMTITGTNFFAGATAYWNGTALATSYVSPTQLTANVPAGLTATITTAAVTVVNPSGVVSNGRGVTVQPPPGQQAGLITTVAGGNGACSAPSGTVGDGGPATSATLNGPSAVAVDATGNLYIADEGNNRVRKVDSSGTISTFAGTGTSGYTGDGGPATSAELSDPAGLAVDSAGNVYISDRLNCVVRAVSPGGVISTFAGIGVCNGSPSSDGGPATSASFNQPTGLGWGGGGNLYIADEGWSRVRKVDSNGIIWSETGGSPNDWYSGDGGPAIDAGLVFPTSVATDAAGNVYIADSGTYRIRKVDLAGIITTYAGGGSPSDGLGDGGQATNAALGRPTGVTVDAAGNVYIADSYTQRIRKVNTNGIITTYAGTGSAGYSGDNGPAAGATLSSPWALAADAAGNLFIADSANNRIRRVAASGTGSGTLLATSLSPPLATAGGTGFQLTVNGIGFASGASAYWDGELLSTEFVNSNQLRATVPAGLVASAGSHSVIVINPPPAVAQTAPILFAVQPVGKAVPSITATPSTILAMWGHPASQAMISWNAPGYNQVEVRINQYNGVLLCTGGPTGSVSTGDWGPELYLLVDPLTQEVLASVTVTMLIDTRNIGTPRQPGRPKHTQAQGGAEGLRRVGDSN